MERKICVENVLRLFGSSERIGLEKYLSGDKKREICLGNRLEFVKRQQYIYLGNRL